MASWWTIQKALLLRDTGNRIKPGCHDGCECAPEQRESQIKG
jgi:hypothetical protein